MKTKVDLQAELTNLFDKKVKVYYQPPANVAMVYPCVVFDLNTANSYFANNFPYIFKKQYTITIITEDPNSDLVDKVCTYFPLSRYNRHFVSDRLYHDVVNIYY